MRAKFEVKIVGQQEQKSNFWTNLRAMGAYSGHWERKESFAGAMVAFLALCDLLRWSSLTKTCYNGNRI